MLLLLFFNDRIVWKVNMGRDDEVSSLARKGRLGAVTQSPGGGGDHDRATVSSSPADSKRAGCPKSDTSKTTLSAKRRHRKPAVDKSYLQRTGMGSYIVPEGGSPLTSLAFEFPGPSSYSPNSQPVQHTYPQWSILARTMYDPRPMKKPAPNRYSPPEVLNWRRRRVPLSDKIKPNKKQVAGPCKAGPAGYRVDNFRMGKEGLKFSVTRGPRGLVCPGPPNAIVTPCDTPGFKSPGPHYDVAENERHLPHSFHATFTSVPEDKPKQNWPAPVDYHPTTPGAHKYPSWSLGRFLPKKVKPLGPGPNAYTLPTTVGDAPAYSIAMPREARDGRWAPSPTAYMREREYFHKEKVQMHMRLPTPPEDKKPGPNKYNLRKEANPKVGFTQRGWVRPGIPMINHSAFAESAETRSPGPAAHSVLRQPYQSENEALKGKTMGRSFVKPFEGRRPGPADHGQIDVSKLSTKLNAPVYSFSLPYRPVKGDPNPGPAAYREVPLDAGKATSLKSRPKPPRVKGRQPGPNTYKIKKGLTRTGAESHLAGISLRSRHSPFVYTGFSRQTLYARQE